jgi:hypothetical protein
MSTQTGEQPAPSDFIRDIVADDLKTGITEIALGLLAFAALVAFCCF